nr:hypothetical protein [Sedimentibacter sp.]
MSIFFNKANKANTIYEPFISVHFTYLGISVAVLIAAILIVTFNRIK